MASDDFAAQVHADGRGRILDAGHVRGRAGSRRQGTPNVPSARPMAGPSQSRMPVISLAALCSSTKVLPNSRQSRPGTSIRRTEQ